ncbi:MAG: sulfite exporter TauE/SafE family protein [Gemmatimonadales bacterium]|nr:MAG: sulfite exporter TauE/SafE family protein [Gemmatimonadales bacterium]
MTPIVLGVALVMGLLTGFFSGLLGIGGGIVMVPFLYLVLSSPEWSGIVAPAGSGAAMAHATSLLVIVPTALSGTLAYRRAGVLDVRGLLPLMVAAALAAIPAAHLAGSLPDDLLRGVFGLFLLVTALRMSGVWQSRNPPDPARRSHRASGGRNRRLGGLVGGSAIGFTSAVLGVGGGIVAIPVLAGWMGMALRQVAAGSVAIILCAAPAGVVSYMWAGRGLEGMPPGSVGFVSVPLALALVPGAVLMAPLGARLNQRLPLSVLRAVFALLLAGVGVRLLWLHLPGVVGGG